MQTYLDQRRQSSGSAAELSSQRSSWQDRALAAYRLSLPDAPELRLKLAAAVYAVAGRAVETDAVLVDPEGRAAFARVDDVLFRWADGRLSILRPCAHCGLGTFVSRPLRSVDDLGFALGDWQPHHDECRPFEVDELW